MQLLIQSADVLVSSYDDLLFNPTLGYDLCLLVHVVLLYTMEDEDI